ncbi:unnamed protein product [Tuwongella immobilis]|uniref:Uncharacterized protein n=1 Tax=Tuwongella immobilis TaxID=692036 RepID=A0A6C2YHE4_9BACT|nr:unnamed protein product [Tuwongella immobilis]VTR96986.1 unnamed protein product [Tuwongella immobilis]
MQVWSVLFSPVAFIVGVVSLVGVVLVVVGPRPDQVAGLDVLDVVEARRRQQQWPGNKAENGPVAILGGVLPWYGLESKV